jgi:hypothetical protein
MFKVTGKNTEIRECVLTCREFNEKYNYKLPKNVSTLMFMKLGSTGPIEVENEAEVKIIDCSIYWIVKGKPYVKHIPFAWIFGNVSYFSEIDPIASAESDFYSSLFGRLYEIFTKNYEYISKNVRLEVLNFYIELINCVKNEFKKSLVDTQTDEYTFQRLLNKYKFFLHPGAMMIESQPKLSGEVTRKPDFHIQLNENEHYYVEIEPPFYKPFNGVKQSQRLKEALSQVIEWKKILDSQAREGKNTHYLILIGHSTDLTEEEKEALKAFNESHKDLIVKTWDLILSNINGFQQKVQEAICNNK